MCISAPSHGKIHSSQIHPWIFCRDYRCRDWGRISHWTPCCKSQGDVSDLLPIQITIGSPLRDPGGNCNRRAGVWTHLWPVASHCSSSHIAARLDPSSYWWELRMFTLQDAFLKIPPLSCIKHAWVDALISAFSFHRIVCRCLTVTYRGFHEANLFFPNLKHNTEALCRAKR